MAKKLRKSRVIDEDFCPICGEPIEVRCVGHRDKPWIDGRRYNVMCFVCFETPKVYNVIRGKAPDGSEDVWEGPFFDGDHLYTPEELVAEGVADDIKRAKISVKAVKNKLKKRLK